MEARGYDAVVVGARCAGSTLAALLARDGRRVLLVDRDRFPSDTVSTHLLFPNALHRLDELGVMRRLHATHDVPMLRFGWRVLGHEVGGEFTPVGGYRRACCVRRIVLDEALVDTAVAAGAVTRFGCEVVGLLGTGTRTDPVRGVVLDTGEAVEAGWVFACDGRLSTVVRRLGLRKTGRLRGEMAMLFAYWQGMPATEWCYIAAQERAGLMSTPCEDGIHLLSLATQPAATRGTAAEREARYHEGLRHFPAVLNPRLLDHAERVSPLVVVPETMMRGYFRRAAGPGWALVGDAGLYSHPITAQGIGDAVEQASYVAEALRAGEDLSDYARWREQRAAEHYRWSFETATFGAGARFAGLSADPAAGQQFLDLFSKHARPAEVFTPERVARWKAARAYEDGRRRFIALVEHLGEGQVRARVPACPAWTVRDLVAHLVGVAEGFVAGVVPDAAPDAWRDPALAEARDRWTEGHVTARSGVDLQRLLLDWATHGSRLETALRRGDGVFADTKSWTLTAPAADLAVHLHDLHELLGSTGDRDTPVTRLGFGIYRIWCANRVTESGLPALRLSDGETSWTLGSGEPQASLTAERYELFRVLSGRRSAAQVRALDWAGDPEVYLPVIAPYPLPAEPGASAVGAAPSESGGAAVEPGASAPGGAASEPGPSERGAAAVEPGPSERGGAASEPSPVAHAGAGTERP